MQTELKVHRVNSEELLHQYVERRLSYLLSRFGDRIGKVTARLASSGSASSDLVCRMTAELRPFGVITAEATDPDAYSAIDRCAGRLARRCESKCARPRGNTQNRATIRMPRIA